MTGFTSELVRVANLNEATKNLIDGKSAQLLEALAFRLIGENKKINLTAVSDIDGIILKHFCDSAAITPYIKEGAKVCDIGCGGGFPSLVIAVLRRDVSVLALDSTAKKIEYVKQTIDYLGLSNVTALSKRAEEAGRDKNYRESFDVVSARAVGRLNLLCELCLPLVKTGGAFIAMKAQTAKEELAEAARAVDLLGGKIREQVSYTLTNGKENVLRTLIIIEKTKNTDSEYPRSNSRILKKPL